MLAVDGEKKYKQGKLLWCNIINLKFINNRRKVDVFGAIFLHLCASTISKISFLACTAQPFKELARRKLEGTSLVH